MPLNINTNSVATSTQNHIKTSNIALKDAMNKLSSGSNINSAKDDAAGLQISNRLQAQSRGFEVAMRNANDAISTLETAESALNEYTEILFRVRDLSLQSVNGSNSKEDRDAIHQEITQLGKELNHIALTTRFAGESLFLGEKDNKSLDKKITFQLGQESGQAMMVTLPNLTHMHGFQSVATSMPSHLSEGIPQGWRTQKGDSISFIYSPQSNGEKEKVITFNEGESVEGVVNILNSSFNNEVKFFIAEETNSDGDNIQKIGYARKLENRSNDAIHVGIFDQNFTSLPKNRLIYSANPFNLGDLRMGFLGLTTFENTSYAKNSTHNDNSLLFASDQLIERLSSYRSNIGANINRITSSFKNLETQNINTQESKSRIKDTDFAKETTKLTKQKIIGDAATSMLAQSQNVPKSIPQLLV
ncbi:TPA: hypothetical protein NKA12_003416 [Vibrio parahaemolyticus]|uniref:flagellin N-terminal helical domain-containing protein n=1 Tax=Vibrio parahaemolyticus TaxID=670 RepID=UPI0011224C38|nr:flagellin [Vibrio parahaemolyticus]TOP60730.1 hypothetical protein CGH13_21705 [Vibrio parahaemolyticus]HCG8654472.1 hypothetical protein [Vibrio parahaemolyticus]